MKVVIFLFPPFAKVVANKFFSELRSLQNFKKPLCGSRDSYCHEKLASFLLIRFSIETLTLSVLTKIEEPSSGDYLPFTISD